MFVDIRYWLDWNIYARVCVCVYPFGSPRGGESKINLKNWIFCVFWEVCLELTNTGINVLHFVDRASRNDSW